MEGEGVNRYIFTGNCTRDPEVRNLASGKTVCEIGVAVSGRKKDDAPVFWDVTFWERTAEIAAEYLKKGKPVLIEGRIESSEWTDKTSGQKRTKMRVVGESLQLLGSREGGEEERPARREQPAARTERRAAPAPARPPADDDGGSDIPF